MTEINTDEQLEDSDPLSDSIARINKKFGKGAIIRLGDAPHNDIDVIPTGILSVDIATGVMGLPRGRIVEFFGPESSGKTLLSLYATHEAQKQGLAVAFVDVEHALNVDFAKQIGVNTDKLFVSQPDSGEEALEIVDVLVNGGGLGLIILDSVAALLPHAEAQGDMGDVHMGLQARLMSQALRKITAPAKRSNVCVIFINQLRMKLNTGGYGSPETTSGGRALSFYSSMRIDVRAVGQIKKDDQVIGRRTRIRIVKNKVASPFKKTDIDLLFNGDTIGFDIASDLLSLGVAHGLIEKKGSWYKMDDKPIGQGAIQASQALAGQEDALRKDILLCSGLTPTTPQKESK